MKSNTEPSRREIIRLGGYGLGALAVSSLCNSRFVEGAPLAPQIRTRAKSVIWLVMNGGQSHVDTWDYKPQLAKSNGKKLKGSTTKSDSSPKKSARSCSRHSVSNSMANVGNGFPTFFRVLPSTSMTWRSCIRAMASQTIIRLRCLR